MSKQSEAAIHGAVHECLSQCRRADTLLGGLAFFVEDLKAKEWDAEDVRIVEMHVLRLLTKLTDRVKIVN